MTVAAEQDVIVGPEAVAVPIVPALPVGQDGLRCPSDEQFAGAQLFCSEMDEERLLALQRECGLPIEYAVRCPGEDETACQGYPGEVCFYEHFFRLGVRFPIPREICQILTWYRVAPGQLVPNAWVSLMTFYVRAAQLGGTASVGLFRSLFSIKVHPGKSGWYYFPARKRSKILVGLSDSIKNWKEKFFFVRGADLGVFPYDWSSRGITFFSRRLFLIRGRMLVPFF